MIEALIAGERNPIVLAEMARGKMRRKNVALIEALTGRFDDHHGELARTLLHQVDVLSFDIDALTVSIDKLIATIPAANAPKPDRDHHNTNPGPGLPAIDRLDEVPGIGPHAAQVIIAEIGLNMGQFRTAAHLVSWAKMSPRTIQSGPKTRTGKTGQGNPYLRSVLGEAAISAGRTNTFLGERYRRLARRRGKHKAIVAVGRSILVICWHLLNDPNTRFNDLGSDFYDQHINKNRKTRNLVRQLQELGHEVNLTPKTV